MDFSDDRPEVYIYRDINDKKDTDSQGLNDSTLPIVKDFTPELSLNLVILHIKDNRHGKAEGNIKKFKL